MKKIAAILAIVVVLFTIGVTLVNAASIERHCEDRCSHFTEPDTFALCYDDCMREFAN